ncbi:BRO family protein [Peribacillus sp. NPDC046944]|uniref:BRO family protein n=1 Tax=unclassified Peribacillus TaxID=2675266 RepID=UPI003D0275CC
MSQLQKVFNYQEQKIRTVIKNTLPWFVAKDVCGILVIKNSRDAVSRLDEDEKAVDSIDTLGGKQNVTLVNEPGLYSLILGSKKPEAKAFKRWVTHEVLPSIRQLGSYSSEKVVALNDKQSLVALMKLSAITAEETEELKLVASEHSNKLLELEKKVEQQITLDHGEQRRLQKGVAYRVYEFTKDKKEAAKLFKELYREIKDRFGVASYKDVKRKELQSAISYIENWIPRKVS